MPKQQKEQPQNLHNLDIEHTPSARTKLSINKAHMAIVPFVLSGNTDVVVGIELNPKPCSANLHKADPNFYQKPTFGKL